MEFIVIFMMFGYVFYVFGSDFLDLDYFDVFIYRGLKLIVSVVVGSVVYLWVIGWVNISLEWVLVVVVWVIGVVGVLVGWYVFIWLMLYYRGIVYFFFFVVVYGLLVFLFVEYGFRMSIGEVIYVGLFVFLGYILYLFFDGFLKFV